MSSSTFSLSQLGWRPAYSQQVSLEELETLTPARVVGVHRSYLEVFSESGSLQTTLPSSLTNDASRPTVGDWVLVHPATTRIVRLLERQSLIARLAAGESHRRQSIAANIDTLFIVTSCNDDFNVSRLERYWALAHEAQVEPVVVVTKSDLCREIDVYTEQIAAVAPRIATLTVNATSPDCIVAFMPWLGTGQTVAVVGSSGVGKSTLVNTLLGMRLQATGGIRENDGKGRHTTTSRQMLPLPSGAWVIDTPGMRELKIGAAEVGVRAVFDDIESLAHACRFRDCAHVAEEGCAVLAAVADGNLDARRLASFQKLQREAANAARTIYKRRERERHVGRVHTKAQRQRRKDKGRE